MNEQDYLTPKNAACALALLWPRSDRRSNFEYWYWMWNCDWNGYEHLLILPPDENRALEQMKQKIETHPFVTQLVNDDL